jgi:hypothetical protein
MHQYKSINQYNLKLDSITLTVTLALSLGFVKIIVSAVKSNWI